MKQYITVTPLFLLALLMSCGKDKLEDKGQVLYKGSPTWTISYTDWHYISNETDSLIDTTGVFPLTGSFKFDKNNEGLFAIQSSPLNLTSYAFSDLPFSWFVKDEIIYIIGEDILYNPSTLAPEISRYYSFSGEMSQDQSSILLDGYFQEENLIQGYEEQRALFVFLVAAK